MTEEQIKHMAERFLCWRLPENFNPDDGISFQRSKKPNGEPFPMPTGTNLFDYSQALEMVLKINRRLPSRLALFRNGPRAVALSLIGGGPLVFWKNIGQP